MSNAQAEVSRNSAVRASGNQPHLRRNFHNSETKAAACRLMKCLGLAPSFRILYVIQSALEAESSFLSVSVRKAADHIIEMAMVAFSWNEPVDYFWFEDCRWRSYGVK